MCDLTNPAFTDEDEARKLLETSRWPDGPVCPFCGQMDTVKPLGGNSMGPGWYYCTDCQDKFTVRVGTLYERSHIPLHKWLLATHLMSSSKKGISAHQLHRMLGVTYKTAWFMSHRIREGMRPAKYPGPLGGLDEIVEVDETYVGGKAPNRKSRKVAKKKIVVALIHRGGNVRTFPVKRVNSRHMGALLRRNVSRKSYLMTDDSNVYPKLGKEFRRHSAVNHSIEEYVRGGAHVNNCENYFSIFKRGVNGVFHHISEEHLPRYLAEFDFRYNNRAGLGVNDGERAALALKGIEGKRLTYRIPNKAADA
jgi:transposase-like protein